MQRSWRRTSAVCSTSVRASQPFHSRRPWLAIWSPIAATIDALVLRAGAELDAVTAPDPESEQALAAVGQGHLDQAASRVRVVNDRLGWWG